MPVQSSVVVRNTQDGITVLGTNQNANDYVTWAAAGDPSGDDVQFVSAHLVESPGFRTALARGILVLEEDENDEEVVAALQRQVSAYKKRTERNAANEVSALDRESGRDVIAKSCVGPNSRGNGNCDAQVTVPEKLKDAQPPLCSQHIHLKSEYIAEESNTPDGVQVKWYKVNIG